MKIGRNSNRLFHIVLMSHNVDFKTLRLCFVDGKTIVYNGYIFPGGRELLDKMKRFMNDWLYACLQLHA